MGVGSFHLGLSTAVFWPSTGFANPQAAKLAETGSTLESDPDESLPAPTDRMLVGPRLVCFDHARRRQPLSSLFFFWQSAPKKRLLICKSRTIAFSSCFKKKKEEEGAAAAYCMLLRRGRVLVRFGAARVLGFRGGGRVGGGTTPPSMRHSRSTFGSPRCSIVWAATITGASAPLGISTTRSGHVVP
nr:hypothetical protein [Pandoravirus massiliensis]